MQRYPDLQRNLQKNNLCFLAYTGIVYLGTLLSTLVVFINTSDQHVLPACRQSTFILTSVICSSAVPL